MSGMLGWVFLLLLIGVVFILPVYEFSGLETSRVGPGYRQITQSANRSGRCDRRACGLLCRLQDFGCASSRTNVGTFHRVTGIACHTRGRIRETAVCGRHVMPYDHHGPFDVGDVFRRGIRLYPDGRSRFSSASRSWLGRSSITRGTKGQIGNNDDLPPNSWIGADEPRRRNSEALIPSRRDGCRGKSWVPASARTSFAATVERPEVFGSAIRLFALGLPAAHGGKETRARRGRSPRDSFWRRRGEAGGFILAVSQSNANQLVDVAASAEVEWHETGDAQTRVRWTLRYRRSLDPAWYFGPWERYADAFLRRVFGRSADRADGSLSHQWIEHCSFARAGCISR